jgi:ketosteroid isomerase-like protein
MPMSEKDKKSAAEIYERMMGKGVAYFNRDLAEVMDRYARNETITIFDLPPPLQYFGFQAVWDLIKEFIDGVDGPLGCDYSLLNTEARGDLGVSYGLVTIDNVLKGGERMKVTIRMTDIWHKIDGKWVVIHEHNSVPLTVERSNELFALQADTIANVPTAVE